MRFRLSPEWCILIKRLKVPPFRRKPESLCAEARIEFLVLSVFARGLFRRAAAGKPSADVADAGAQIAVQHPFGGASGGGD